MDITLSKPTLLSEKHQRIIAASTLLLVFITLTWAAYLYLPIGQDWRQHYKPAALTILQGNSPYSSWGIFVPPWTFLPLIPFALLPAQLGRALLFTVSLVSFALISYRLKAKPAALVAILFSYPVLFSLLYGNLEWLISLGFILPPQIGLFFVLIKPQLGAPVALFWLMEAWREGKAREVVRVFLPVTLAFLISFAIFGFWPLLAIDSGVIEAQYNSSLWPQSIPIGVVLLVSAIRTRRLGLAMIAAPLLSPYVAPQSWSIAVLGLASMPVEVVLMSMGFWIVRMMTGQFLR